MKISDIYKPFLQSVGSIAEKDDSEDRVGNTEDDDDDDDSMVCM